MIIVNLYARIFLLALVVNLLGVTYITGLEYRMDIEIETLINNEDADSSPGPSIPVGELVSWTYKVENAGNVPLLSITVTDSVPGVIPIYQSGDINGDGLLDPGEIWTYRAQGTATAGQHENIGKAAGGDSMNNRVHDSDSSFYFGISQKDETLEEKIAPAMEIYDNRVPGSLIYETNFSAWVGEKNEIYDMGFQNEKYHIKILKENNFAFTSSERIFDDFILEVDAAIEEGPYDNMYGVVLRGVKEAEKEKYYLFRISSTGKYSFVKWNGALYEEIIPWTPSTAINPGVASNKIKVKCSGDKFIFYVNEAKLDECVDGYLSSGNIGIGAGTFLLNNVHASFSNLKVWKLEQEASLETPSLRPEEDSMASSAAKLPHSDNFSSRFNLSPGVDVPAPATAIKTPVAATRTSKKENTAPTTDLLYSDDFSSYLNWRDKWAIHVNKDGRHYITISKREYWSLRNPTIKAFKDCIIEAEAALEDDSQDSAFGLQFRHTKNNFYRFKISGKGEFGFDLQKNGKWAVLVPWTKSAAINTGKASNLIRVQCRGNRFTFYVNGVNLGEYIDDTFPDSGKVGVFADSASSNGVQVSFDNLKIWAVTA